MASKSSSEGVVLVRLEFQVTIIPKLHPRIIPRRKPTQVGNPGGKHGIKYDIFEATFKVSPISWKGQNRKRKLRTRFLSNIKVPHTLHNIILQRYQDLRQCDVEL